MKSIFDFSAKELKFVDKETFEFLANRGNQYLAETVKQSSVLSQRSYTIMAFVFAFYSLAMNTLISGTLIWIKIGFIVIFVLSLILLFLAAIPYRIMPANRPPRQRNMEAFLMSNNNMPPYHYLLAAEILTIQKDIDSNTKNLNRRTKLFTYGLVLFFTSYLVIIIYSIL